MYTIGILLPGSTLYPSVGIDFLQGARSYLSDKSVADVQIQASSIGFGLQESDILKEAEKLLFNQQAEVIVFYGPDLVARSLAPLIAAAGKLLVVVNAGAHYPIKTNEAVFRNTIFVTLNDCVCAYLSGKLAFKEEGTPNAAMATSFYDGGYQHTHAMVNAFIEAGGSIQFNFISPLKKEEFSILPLGDFFSNNTGTKKILALYSGDMAREFYERIAPIQQAHQLQLYGSTMMFDRSPGDFAINAPFVQSIRGYASWVPELTNSENRHFLQSFKDKQGKEASLFAMQGWETAQIIHAYLELKKKDANSKTAIAELLGHSLETPRGKTVFNEDRYLSGPAYLLQAKDNLNISIESALLPEMIPFQSMMDQIPDTEFSCWRNTYLCI